MALVNIALLVSSLSLITVSDSDITTSYESHLYCTDEYSTFLTTPTKINSVQFLNYKFEFQNGKLPEYPVTEINILTKEDKPILFEIICSTNGQRRSYYYILNKVNNKLSNFSIKGTKFIKDSNDLKYYTTSAATDILSNLPKLERNVDNFQVDESHQELILIVEVDSQKIANKIKAIKGDSPTPSVDNENDIIETEVPVSNGKPEKKSPNFPFKHYAIDEEDRTILKYPDELQYVKFDTLSLKFGSESILPDGYTWSYDVITCKHKVVIFVIIKVEQKPKKKQKEIEIYDIEEPEDFKTFLGNTLINTTNLAEGFCKDHPVGIYPEERESQSSKNFEVVQENSKSLREEDNDNSCYPMYQHVLHPSHQSRQKSEIKIKEIKFNTGTMRFGKRAKLPELHCWSFDLITCKHGFPILVILKSGGVKYFKDKDKVHYTCFELFDFKSVKKFEGKLLEEFLACSEKMCESHKFH